MERYRNFDLELFGYRRQADQEGFRVRVASSPAGEQRRRDAAAVRFDAGLRAAVQRLDGRQLDLAGLIELGERLAALLLPPAARGFLDRSRARLDDDEGLRIRIKLDSWTLADLPWEYAYVAPPDTPPGQEDAAGFLALDRRLSLVRYELLGLAPGRFEAVEGGPRLVALLASPSGLAPLDLDRETAAIRRALDEARRDDGPEIRWDLADGGTLHDLERSLDAEAHLFHFAGHGHFDAEPGEDYGAVEGKGSLILEDASGAPAPVAAETLGLNLRGCGVRLAVLAACEGARRDRVNAWTGIAPALVRHGIPAVVAMQLDLRDDCAVAFSTRFYESLAAGQPVDAAVAAGRLAIFNRRGAGERDWGVPVLYLRAASGVLFPRPEETAPAAVEPPPTAAPVPPEVDSPPPPRRFWGNLALGLGVAGLLLWLYTQAVHPRLETGWLVGGGATAAAALLALLRWLAEDDLKTSARKWLKQPKTTGALAAGLVVLALLNVAAHLLQPVVVRLVPGTSLMPDMARADRATPATHYTLRLRAGDREWECHDLRKPGCAIGASESEVRIALARHRQPIEDRLRQYLIHRGVPEDLVDRWLALWQLRDPEKDARPRLKLGDELSLELSSAGTSVSLRDPVVQLKDLADDPVRVIFLEKEGV